MSVHDKGRFWEAQNLKLEALDHRSPTAIVMGWTPSPPPPGGRGHMPRAVLVTVAGKVEIERAP